jgi:hypothetical protein
MQIHPSPECKAARACKAAHARKAVRKDEPAVLPTLVLCNIVFASRDGRRLAS